MTPRRDIGPRRRRLSREEAMLWLHVVKNVTPLPGRRHPEPPPEPATEENGRAKPEISRPPLPPLPLPAIRVLPDLSHGDAPDVDKRTAERLRKGKMEIEARIDLHGHTQESAHRALHAFIEASTSAGRRCVLVITGKGFRGPDSGILRQMVPRWLNTSPLRSRVLSFSFARPADGGEGALYVLLRRNRGRS